MVLVGWTKVFCLRINEFLILLGIGLDLLLSIWFYGDIVFGFEVVIYSLEVTIRIVIFAKVMYKVGRIPKSN